MMKSPQGITTRYLPDCTCFPGALRIQLGVHPSQSPRLLINDAGVTAGMSVTRMAIERPDRLPREEFTVSLGQPSDGEWTWSPYLASPESLHHEPIERIAKRTDGCFQRQNPTIHLAVLIANLPRRLCSKLEDEERLAIPAKDLRASIFVCVPVWNRMSRPTFRSSIQAVFLSLTHGAPAPASVELHSIDP